MYGQSVPVRRTADEVLTMDRPTLVGVALGRDGHEAIVGALESGAAVLAAPPLARDKDEYARVIALLSQGASLRALHLWRRHPASRLAAELLAQGALGRVLGVSLVMGDELDEDARAVAIAEAVDLFTLFTDERLAVVQATDSGPDPEHLDHQLLLATSGDGSSLEVWVDSDPEAPNLALSLIGERGELQWDVTTGRLVSALRDDDGAERDPVVLAAGAPGSLDEWVIT